MRQSVRTRYEISHFTSHIDSDVKIRQGRKAIRYDACLYLHIDDNIETQYRRSGLALNRE